MRRNAPTRTTYVAVTEAVSDDRIKAIKNAKTAGQLFYATGGRHLNSDEFFKARAIAEREAKLKKLKDDKKLRVAAAEIQDQVMQLLQQKGNLLPENEQNFTVSDLKLLVVKWKKACF